MGEALRRRPRPAVHIVDDDAQVRRAIWFMLESAGYAPRVFACADDLLDELDYLPLAPLISDLQMPGIDGLQLLGHVRRRALAVPVIMISGHGSIASAVRVMQAGAIDFIEKPFEQARLLAAVDAASATLNRTFDDDAARRDAIRRVAELSARERDVLAGLVAGKPNKLIAFDLGLSIRTVEMHRVRMMRRLAVRTLPEALRLSHLAEPAPVPRGKSLPQASGAAAS